MDVRRPALARAAALFLMAWTLLVGIRVVVAVIRGNWDIAVVGVALLAASVGIGAWAWKVGRSNDA